MRLAPCPRIASTSLVVIALLAACTPSVDDDSTEGDVGNDEVESPNGAPPTPVVEVSDPMPGTTVHIWAELAQTVDDPDGDTVAIRWSWRRLAPSPSDGPRENVLPAAYTTRGDVWEVQAVAFDGLAESPAGVAQVEIVDTPPSVSLAVLPSVARVTDSLVAVVLGWDADADATTTELSWSIDGIEVGTGATLPAGTAVAGQEVVVRATAAANGLESERAEVSLEIHNSSAMAERIDLSPSDPTVASPITATGHGSDADGDPLTWTWTWEVDGAVVSEVSPVLQPSSFVRGSVVRAFGQPEDPSGHGFGRWSPPLLVGNSAPTADPPTLSPASLTADSVASCAPSGLFDLDGDAVDWTIRWSVDGTMVGEGETLGAPFLVRGTSVQCEVVPDDGFDEGPPAASAAVVVGNAAPTAPTVTIEPVEPQAGEDDLLCVIDGASIDADGDALSYTISWTLDGAPWPAPGSPPTDPAPETLVWPFDTVPAEATEAAQTWACEASAFDGWDSSGPGAATILIDGPQAAPDFSLFDANTNSPSFGAAVSPRDLLQQVSGWYFIHST